MSRRSRRETENVRIEAAHCAATILADEAWEGDNSKRRLWSLCVFFETYIVNGASGTKRMMVAPEPKRRKAPVIQLITRDK